MQAVMPFDLTVVLGALLALALLIRVLRRPIVLPPALWLLVPTLLMLLVGIVRPVTAYGAEKAMRFCTLTSLALLAGSVFLDQRRSISKFLLGLGVLGFLMSLDAVHSQQATQYGRLTFSGSSPIALARVGTLAFAFGWLRFHFSRSLFDRLLAAGIVCVTAVCVLASGSRGPALSVVASLVLVSLLCAWKHGRSPIALKPILVLGTAGLLMSSLISLSIVRLGRFEMLLSEDKGASVLVRGLLYVTALKQIPIHPFGLGVGGFERVAFLDMKYPHNLFLEVGCELGWVPLVCLAILVVSSLRTMARVVSREYTWASIFLAVVLLTALANAMVSGDLNDNRLLFAVLLLPFVYKYAQDRDGRAGAPAGRDPLAPVVQPRHI